MQIFMQEKILLAVHKGCTLEEAREKELHADWCLVRHWFASMSNVLWFSWEAVIINLNWWLAYSYSVFWLPPTLSRVLHALGTLPLRDYVDKWYLFHQGRWKICYMNRYDEDIDDVCCRKWIDATLFGQSEETQKTIAWLLWWKE